MMAGSKEEAWDALVGDLYLSSIDHEAAARLAPAISSFFNAGTAAFWGVDSRTGGLAGRMLHNFLPENMALYAEHWFRYDPWTLPLVQSGFEGVIRGQELIEDATLIRHPFYAEYGVNTGHFHVMGSIIQPHGRTSRVGAIAVQRARHLGAFSDEELLLLKRLLPHARRAFELDLRVSSTLLPMVAGRAALDMMRTAAVALDGAGRVLHANSAAEALDLGAGPIRLRRQGEDNRISTLRPADTAWLREAAADAARGGAGGARRLRDAADQVHAAVVTPLPKRLADQAELGWLPGMALLVLRLIEPLGVSPRLEELCMGLFDLTRAEAQASCLLAGGMSPEDIAEARMVRVSTIRTLLTRAMDKSGARNLRHLVALLASLSA